MILSTLAPTSQAAGSLQPFVSLSVLTSLSMLARASRTEGSLQPYFAEWGDGRLAEPTCVDIPGSIALCQDIGYERMRLPNLLAHDTLQEVAQQSGSWVPLSQVGCHPDTQLFLCSLF